MISLGRPSGVGPSAAAGVRAGLCGLAKRLGRMSWKFEATNRHTNTHIYIWYIILLYIYIIILIVYLNSRIVYRVV